jgi:MoxR-like ATPase
LLVDEPLSAKTLFQWELKTRIILIDEIDKLPKQFQNKLLNFLESRRIRFEIIE